MQESSTCRCVGLPGHLWARDMCVSPVQHVQVDGDGHEAQQQQRDSTSTNIPDH